MRPTHALAALVALASPVLGATASITSIIPNQAHQCIKLCAWYNYQGNIPVALGCDDPYENDCYCPTATESVSRVSVAIEKCVSSRCGAGDYTRDLSSLRSIYAGYCKDAGFTQDAAMLGYTAATTADPTPSTTASSLSSSTAVTGAKTDSSSQASKTTSGGASTTTQRTTVTQTRASGADGTSSSVVVVQETETVFVDGAKGSKASGPSMAIKIGLGVAVPVVVLLIMGGVGLLIFRKRRAAAARRRALADTAIAEEHGGGGQEQREMEKDMGTVKAYEPSARAESAPKQGAIVYGLQEVQGSNGSDSYEVHGEHAAGAQEVYKNDRSDSYEVQGNHTAGAQEVHGNHRPGPYGVHESYRSDSHELHGSYRSDSHEAPGDHAARLHEAHGNHVRPELPGQSVDANAAAELPGSNGQGRWN
ncbi:hypothetical protein LLEC1_05287 [Akanthomyces lecanii]|uniref:CFEM domain-containing protein n=1 Tax=Cordyceps confragosa TaxID=2714763 RepID=A0A179I309_CORDF|nr:hypothetical protein LLEC1_05287 [Akanthomyces lecanii]